jgi:hypothetical protein
LSSDLACVSNRLQPNALFMASQVGCRSQTFHEKRRFQRSGSPLGELSTFWPEELQMSVAKCANPDCKAEFRRLGDGKLFVKTLKNATGLNGLSQRAAWLCNRCCDNGFDLRFDRRTETFNLITHRKAA